MARTSRLPAAPSALVLTLLTLWAASPQVGQASSFYARPFPDTVQDSPVIARGRVENKYSDWGKATDGVRRLYTFYKLTVSEVFKGAAEGPSILMRELGGEKDGMGMEVAGAAQFQKGEDVVVMMSNRNPDGSYDVLGLMMGKLNIVRDENGQEALNGPALQPAEHGDVHEDAHTPATYSLQQLRQIIAAQAQTHAHVTAASPSAAVSASPGPKLSTSPAPSAAPQLQTAVPTEGAAASPTDGEDSRFHALGFFLALCVLGAGFWMLRVFRKKD